MGEKTTQLFVRLQGSDGQWWLCGGPDADEAHRGLTALIKEYIRQLMHGELPRDKLEVEVCLRQLSEIEIEALPEV